MELLNEIIEKAHEAQALLEAECHQDASFAIAAMEELLIQMPAGVEDWAHALRDEFRLLTEARQWMGRDPRLAIAKIEQAVTSFEAINREASARHTSPELPEDVAAGQPA
ncbi:MAG: hypothetical protein ACE37H_17230 [Phycisphaeraceae bacterium]